MWLKALQCRDIRVSEMLLATSKQRSRPTRTKWEVGMSLGAVAEGDWG